MMYLGSINDQVWDMTESGYDIIDPDNLTNQDKANKQCNTMSLNTIYNAIDFQGVWANQWLWKS